MTPILHQEVHLFANVATLKILSIFKALSACEVICCEHHGSQGDQVLFKCPNEALSIRHASCFRVLLFSLHLFRVRETRRTQPDPDSWGESVLGLSAGRGYFQAGSQDPGRLSVRDSTSIFLFGAL